MGDYEEIKEKSARILPLQAMAEAALEQGDVNKAIEFAVKFKNEANVIRCEYPSRLAAYVAYLNAAGMLGRLYSSVGDTRSAYAESTDCLFNIHDFMIKNVDDEICCQSLLMQTLYSMLELLDLLPKQSDNSDFGTLVYEHAKLFYYIYSKLKLINPENQCLEKIAPRAISFMEQAGISEIAEGGATDEDYDGSIDEIRHLSIELSLI